MRNPVVRVAAGAVGVAQSGDVRHEPLPVSHLSAGYGIKNGNTEHFAL